MVDHQALRHREQVGARVLGGAATAGEQPHEHFVGQFRRGVRAVQLAPQEAAQRADVREVERSEGGRIVHGEDTGQDSRQCRERAPGLAAAYCRGGLIQARAPCPAGQNV